MYSLRGSLLIILVSSICLVILTACDDMSPPPQHREARKSKVIDSTSDVIRWIDPEYQVVCYRFRNWEGISCLQVKQPVAGN